MEILQNELNKVKDLINKTVVDNTADESIIKFLSGPSKMVRSKLALLYLKSLGVNLSDGIYKILAAGEIIHNASLMHDDVLDDAEKRRGQDTLSKIYSSKFAILSGDYLVSTAINNLLVLNNFDVLKIFNDCIKNMTLSEIKQFFSKGKINTEDDYISICKGKTGALFSAIMESCAIEADLDRDNAKFFGEIFGICFQIKNDSSEKSMEEDKKNGLHTAVDVLGIEKTRVLLDNYKKELESILQNVPVSDYKRALGDLINYYVR